MIIRILILWYLAVNIILFCLMGIDKYKAKHNKWRIPEATLLSLSLLGAPVGGFAGMHLFHHKTKKLYFHIVFWTAALLHITILIYLTGRFT